MDMLDECRSAESLHEPEEHNISKDERPTTTRAASSSTTKQTCCREQRSDAVNGIKPEEELQLLSLSSRPTRDKVRNPIHEETLSAYMLESYDNGNNLTDVTVHCDSHAFHAHRLVLGHYSEFFRVVFESLTTVSHYDVYLEGFSPREVEVVLLFMYTGGVVCCGNERLDAFIDVAQALHIPSLYALLVSEMEKPCCDSPEVPPPDDNDDDDEDMDKEHGKNHQPTSSPVSVWEKCAADRQSDECVPTEPVVVEEVVDRSPDDDNDDDDSGSGHREDDERNTGKDGSIISAAANAAGRSRKQARPQRHAATPSPDRTPCDSPSSRIGTSTPSPSPSYIDELLPDDDDDDDDDIIEDDIDDDDEEHDVVVAPPRKRANSSTPPRTPPPPRKEEREEEDEAPQNLRHPDVHRHPLPLPPPQLMFLRNMMPPAQHSPVNPPPPPPPGFFSPGQFVVPPPHHHHHNHPHHPHHHGLQQPPGGGGGLQQKQRMMKDKVLWGKILKHQHFHASSRAQHSAPRGGPPRAWSNQDLTEALHNVWNKKMTTSQASRIFGIPYNSLLMYVRGKYGKSLKLDLLKKGLDLALLEKQNKHAIQKLAESSPSPSSGSGGGVNESSSPRKLQQPPPGQNNNPSPMHKQHVVEWMMMSGGNSSGPGGGSQQQQPPPPSGPGVMGKQQQQPLHHALFHAHFQGHFDQQRK